MVAHESFLGQPASGGTEAMPLESKLERSQWSEGKVRWVNCDSKRELVVFR
jgi:hypothetical protein